MGNQQNTQGRHTPLHILSEDMPSNFETAQQIFNSGDSTGEGHKYFPELPQDIVQEYCPTTLVEQLFGERTAGTLHIGSDSREYVIDIYRLKQQKTGDNRGESIMKKGESIMKRGESVMKKGESVMKKGESVMKRGESVMSYSMAQHSLQHSVMYSSWPSPSRHQLLLISNQALYFLNSNGGGFQWIRWVELNKLMVNRARNEVIFYWNRMSMEQFVDRKSVTGVVLAGGPTKGVGATLRDYLLGEHPGTDQQESLGQLVQHVQLVKKMLFNQSLPTYYDSPSQPILMQSLQEHCLRIYNRDRQVKKIQRQRASHVLSNTSHTPYSRPYASITHHHLSTSPFLPEQNEPVLKIIRIQKLQKSQQIRTRYLVVTVKGIYTLTSDLLRVSHFGGWSTLTRMQVSSQSDCLALCYNQHSLLIHDTHSPLTHDRHSPQWDLVISKNACQIADVLLQFRENILAMCAQQDNLVLQVEQLPSSQIYKPFLMQVG